MLCVQISDENIVTQTIDAPNASWCEKYIGGNWLEFGNTEQLIYDCGVGMIWDETEKLFKPQKLSSISQEEYENNTINLKNYKLLNKIREKRSKLLERTDKYVNSDYPHPTEEAKQAWLDYRQALRDLPTNTTDPENPIWPVAPSS
jgi:hypothetical protein